MKTRLLSLLAGGLLAPGVADAHVPSTAQIVLSVRGRHLSGHWAVALRDVEYALGLDDDGDGKLTWGEVKAGAAEIARYCRAHLVLRTGEHPVRIECGAPQLDRRSDGVYAVVPLSAELPSDGAPVQIGYDAFFALDPLHRGVLRLAWAGSRHSAVFGPEGRSRTFLPPSPQ